MVKVANVFELDNSSNEWLNVPRGGFCPLFKANFFVVKPSNTGIFSEKSLAQVQYY